MINVVRSSLIVHSSRISTTNILDAAVSVFNSVHVPGANLGFFVYGRHAAEKLASFQCVQVLILL